MMHVRIADTRAPQRPLGERVAAVRLLRGHRSHATFHYEISLQLAYNTVLPGSLGLGSVPLHMQWCEDHIETEPGTTDGILMPT